MDAAINIESRRNFFLFIDAHEFYFMDAEINIESQNIYFSFHPWIDPIWIIPQTCPLANTVVILDPPVCLCWHFVHNFSRYTRHLSVA